MFITQQNQKILLFLQGYTCEYDSFSDSNDLAAVVEGTVSNCDIICVPTDNTVAANTAIIYNITICADLGLTPPSDIYTGVNG